MLALKVHSVYHRRMKMKEFTLARKFNTGNYTTRDFSATFDLEDSDYSGNGRIKPEILSEARKQFEDLADISATGEESKGNS